MALAGTVSARPTIGCLIVGVGNLWNQLTSSYFAPYVYGNYIGNGGGYGLYVGSGQSGLNVVGGGYGLNNAYSSGYPVLG